MLTRAVPPPPPCNADFTRVVYSFESNSGRLQGDVATGRGTVCGPCPGLLLARDHAARGAEHLGPTSTPVSQSPPRQLHRSANDSGASLLPHYETIHDYPRSGRDGRRTQSGLLPRGSLNSDRYVAWLCGRWRACGQDEDNNWWQRYIATGLFRGLTSDGAGTFTRYGLSLYWVMQTMMAVGYA